MRKLIYLILSLVAVPVFAQKEQWVRSSSLGFKGGFWSVTKANTNEYPFRYDPKNVVYQVGIVYYFNTDVWRNKTGIIKPIAH